MHLTSYINCSVFIIALTSLSVELISYHYYVEQLLIDTSFLLKRICNTFMNIGYSIGRPVTQRAERLHTMHRADRLRNRTTGYVTGVPLCNRRSYASVRNIYIVDIRVEGLETS